MPKPTRARRSSRKSENPDLYRQRLVEQQQEILSLYERDLKVGQESSNEGTDDIVDRANNSYNREFMFALSDTERQILVEIEDALGRLDKGSYGTCVHCSDEIPKARLKALPWARYCIDCQEQVEQGVVLDG